MGRYFGTDGFRGEANVSLTAVHAYKIGRFVGAYFSSEKPAKILIGKDTRRSGDMLESALVSGILSSGADAAIMCVTTTPCVSYITKTGGFDCGIMISASHNAFYDNGIKLLSAAGGKIDPGIEEKIEEYIDSEADSLPLAKRACVGRVFDFGDSRKKYMEHLKAAAGCRFDGMKIAFDCANGSASALAPVLFKELGVDAYIINNSPDGVNINEDCGSTHIETLGKYVTDNHLDGGFAFDGDADRCLAVDNCGNVLDGDVIMYICGRFLKEHDRLSFDTVVATVMSNLGLYKSLEKLGISVETTDVGDKYVSERMRSGGFSLGGEQSGHIIFAEHATTGDGMLTAIMMMNALADHGTTLSELACGAEILPQLLLNVEVKDKDAILKNEFVLREKERIQGELGDGGRLLLRKSGTEPLIRIMVEAGDDEICRDHVMRMARVIRSVELGDEV